MVRSQIDFLLQKNNHLQEKQKKKSENESFLLLFEIIKEKKATWLSNQCHFPLPHTRYR